jgi:hypothetical protein
MSGCLILCPPPPPQPLSVMHWLMTVKPTADVIVVVDPDVMFVAPIDFVELVRWVCEV